LSSLDSDEWSLITSCGSGRLRGGLFTFKGFGFFLIMDISPFTMATREGTGSPGACVCFSLTGGGSSRGGALGGIFAAAGGGGGGSGPDGGTGTVAGGGWGFGSCGCDVDDADELEDVEVSLSPRSV
jgi:hypothetical protein